MRLFVLCCKEVLFLIEGVYAHDCYLYYGDYDVNGHLRLSTVLQLLSDIAGIAYTNVGYSRDW